MPEIGQPSLTIRPGGAPGARVGVWPAREGTTLPSRSASVTLIALGRSFQDGFAAAGPASRATRRGHTVTTKETDTSGLTSDAPDEAGLAGRPGERLAISALILLILLSLLASNAPDSTIKSGLLTVVRPFILITGLDQRWGVFAPNPRLETSNVAARVERADGTVGVYPVESGNGLSEYWNYRWRKYGEQLWIRTSTERERAAFARWIAEQDRAAGHRPLRVTLVRTTRPNLPPGPGPDTEPWREITFSTTTVGMR